MVESVSKVHPVDEFVGERLKQIRKKHKLSQTALGKLVGVSFQQIQKYERGLNRIPASKLFEFSEVLNAPVTYFYEGMSIEDKDLDIVSDGTRLKFKRTTPLKILLVEHEPADVIRARKVIESCKQASEIHVVHDGIKAKQFLFSKKKRKPFSRPDIIISALKLPKIDGLDLLKEIKRDRDLKDIPVIIISNSVEYADMMKSYKLQASGFIGKSVDDNEFAEHLEIVVNYWAKAVVLPVM